MGLRFRLRVRNGPQGAVRRHGEVHFTQEERTGVDAGLAPEGVQALGTPRTRGADLGQRHAPGDRLPGHHLLRGAQVAGGRPEEPGRRGPGDPQRVRQAGDTPGRAEAAERRRHRRSARQRIRSDDLPADARRRGGDILPDLRGGSEASGPSSEVHRLGRPLLRQFLCHAQLGRLQ